MATNVQIDGAWTLQLTNTSFHGRQRDLATLIAGAAGDPTVARSGVIPRVSSAAICQDLLTKQRTDVGSLKVDVLPGAAVINRSGQGPYIAYNSTPRAPTLSASSPTQTRIDLIVLHAYDIALGDTNPNSAGTYAAYVEVFTGTPGAGVPATPAGTLLLAQCSVPANAANSNQVTVTPMRTSTGVNGAMRWMLEADLVTPPTALLDGESRWLEGAGGGSGVMQMWSAGAWVNALQFGPHTSYTPVFGMQTANGTALGRYWRSGQKCAVSFAFTATAGVSLGTGAITVTMPFTAVNTGVGTNHAWLGNAEFGGGAGYLCDVVLNNNSNTATLLTRSGAAGTASTPGNAGVAFASGNFISGSITFEAA